MFGLFSSEKKKMRRNARNWLHLAKKIYHFRRDQLTDAEVTHLQQGMNDLRSKVKNGADASMLKLSIERLEDVLRNVGGSHYPRSWLAENVEFFFVAAILFIGFRTFFVRPFHIPTNSMWPTYYGRTAEVFHEKSEEPGIVGEAARFLMLGASNRTVVAPDSGELRVPLVGTDGDGWMIPHQTVPSHRWLVLPAVAWKYTLRVGDKSVPVTVPQDFQLGRDVLRQILDNGKGDYMAYLIQQMQKGDYTSGLVTVTSEGHTFKEIPARYVATGIYVNKGQHALAFDILTGDMLFVDCFSYNFVRPKVGQGFVFRTWHIKNIEPGRVYTDKFFVKRLVGLPGDTLQVEAPVLWRNGAPINGAGAFAKEARQIGKYPGYTNVGLLSKGETVTVPKHFFFAMGDNSPISLDGRYWGFVPARDVVGKPLFIYYPFTSRWGPAH